MFQGEEYGVGVQMVEKDACQAVFAASTDLGVVIMQPLDHGGSMVYAGKLRVAFQVIAHFRELCKRPVNLSCLNRTQSQAAANACKSVFPKAEIPFRKYDMENIIDAFSDGVAFLGRILCFGAGGQLTFCHIKFVAYLPEIPLAVFHKLVTLENKA